jgi:TctA family transporter
VKLLTVPYRFLYPAILTFCCIGVYSVNNQTFDVFMAAAFGVIGYLFLKLKCEPAPLLLGFVLGPMMEENFRRSLLLSRGDFTVFVTRPLSMGLLIALPHWWPWWHCRRSRRSAKKRSRKSNPDDKRRRHAGANRVSFRGAKSAPVSLKH